MEDKGGVEGLGRDVEDETEKIKNEDEKNLKNSAKNDENDDEENEDKVKLEEGGDNEENNEEEEFAAHHSEEEVAEKLFKMDEIKQNVESFWGWASNSLEKLKSREEFKKVSAELDNIKANVKTEFSELKNNFEKLLYENDGNNAEKDDNNQGQKVNLPWEPATKFSKEIKERILALSEDSNTFLVSPPKEVEKTFLANYSSEVQNSFAEVMLSVDKKLQKKRSELVPRSINEDNFWKNYYYRVELIKNSYNMQSEGKHEPVEKVDDIAAPGVNENEGESESFEADDNFDMEDFDDEELLAAVEKDNEIDDVEQRLQSKLSP